MIDSYEEKKMEEEMRKFCKGSIIIPDGVNLTGRRGIRKVMTKEEPVKKKGRISIVAGVTRIISRLRR